MNILFLTEGNVFPPKGGAARITVTLSKDFEERGHKCFHLFGWDNLNEKSLEKTLSDNHINVVISNLVKINFKKRVLPIVYKLTRSSNIKLLVCFHAMPGEELIGNSFGSCVYRLFHGGGVISNIKDIFLNLFPRNFILSLFSPHIKNRYKLLYDNSDKVVLLSETHIKDFMELGGIENEEKFVVIPNSLSFNYFLKEEELAFKQKEIMLLSRMDEKSKRVTDALRVWRNVCSLPGCEDWRFTIIGGGPDLGYFKRVAKRMRLERISFEGRQEDEIKYYKRASIFMMTSAYEGWGITLTEAQQMGVVPIVFHSYKSLEDLIEDGKNGIIVKYRDFDEYRDKLSKLMTDKERRDNIAKEAIASSHRFSSDVIMDKWENLFTP